MNSGLAAFSIVAAFAAGVAVHKYVISEAERIKSHVTNAVMSGVLSSETRIRADVAAVLNRLASKV